MARPNKGERDQMMVYPPRALGDLVRAYADTIQVPHGEYIASVLAERLRLPSWAAAEVRLVKGGLPAMLAAQPLPSVTPSPTAWEERDMFVTKPVKALGQIIRVEAQKSHTTLTRYITEHLAAFHGVDLDARTIDPAHVVGSEDSYREFRIRPEEVERLLA